MTSIAALERLLKKGQDSALLRYGLASAYFSAGSEPDLSKAAQHLKACLALDPNYTAAYKMFAKVLGNQGQPLAALQTLEQGIGCAENAGDMQAKREMEISARRLRKQLTLDQG